MNESAIIALAAVMQSALQAQRLATRGETDKHDVRLSIESLFSHSQDPAERYHAPRGLHNGLHRLKRILEGQEVPRGKELLHYTASLLALERKLASNEEALQRLSASMQQVEKQRQYFEDSMHESVIGGLSKAYGDTLSLLKPRIVVHGKPEFLRVSQNQDMIRVFLLSGVRAAHVWRAEGGKHWQLLFRRKLIVQQAAQLLTAEV